LAGLLAWATTEEIARNPARDATADLGTQGPVTIRFSTDPYPALPTGPVILRFVPMDPRGRGVTLDGLSFEYGREGDEETVGVGETQSMSDGSGMWMSAAQFPSVGDWWNRPNRSERPANRKAPLRQVTAGTPRSRVSGAIRLRVKA
jgi:hypothetical protein